MSNKPKILVIKTAGTNCDYEMGFAFEMAGGEVEYIHINSIIKGKIDLMDYHILALPGGFSYGDDIASGKIFANELRYKLKSKVKTFLDEGNLLLGVCNGFQILVKAGLLPSFYGDDDNSEITLTLNDSAKFEDRWVYLNSFNCNGPKTDFHSKCVWTKDLDDRIYLPVAHGEGKFIPKNESALRKLKERNLIVFQYVDEAGALAGYPHNPNGSVFNIAGITDPTGRILGMMPHPERHIQFTQHPRWTRLEKKPFGDGFKIFQNGIEFVKKNLI